LNTFKENEKKTDSKPTNEKSPAKLTEENERQRKKQKDENAGLKNRKENFETDNTHDKNELNENSQNLPNKSDSTNQSESKTESPAKISIKNDFISLRFHVFIPPEIKLEANQQNCTLGIYSNYDNWEHDKMRPIENLKFVLSYFIFKKFKSKFHIIYF
jgi:hypothetical protein